jgi:diadenosine tetraphosphate (Ap4A) HIT family hydrolase
MSFVPLHGVSPYHLLVAPKHHIQNVESLKTLKDVEMLKEMIQFGKQALKEIDGNMNVDAAQFCFHVPPYNSIDHLHLHAVGNPQSLSFLGWLKYFPDSLWCKTAQKLIHELEESQT